MNPKKNKKKKVKETKSKEQRHLEVEELKTQLDQIGINPTFESYNQLLKRLDEFVDSGVADCFGIAVTEINSKVNIILSNKVKCNATVHSS
jgi:hypothetical protein|tara:strand:- start:694 stop:966 length:273 start_codon:yes stop_codon:yes gene_type:complete